jgi:NAD kinase
MSFDDCVVLTKSSVLVYDANKMNRSQSEVLSWYRDQGYPESRISAILASHHEQVSAIEEVNRLFERAGIDDQRVFNFDQLSHEERREIFERFPLVISLGGDDHAKAVSRYVNSEQFFCIINSDTTSSNGVLTYYDRRSIGNLFERLSTGDFLIEEWPRLQVTINRTVDGVDEKVQCAPALSEISIADEFTLYTFRGVAQGNFLSQPEIIKGSGLLIANGAGSTGWFSSAARYIYPEGRSFPRTSLKAEYVVREPYGDRRPEASYTSSFESGDVLVIRTSSKHSPEVSGDSVWREPLPAGAEAIISLSEKPLKVISNQRPVEAIL